jgi:hypothetical protein
MSARTLLVSLSLLTFFAPGCASDGPAITCLDDGDCYCSASGELIDESWLCDGDNDCGDWEDERGCPGVRIADLPCEGLRTRSSPG